MLIREFTYKDYNGKTQKETFCFNLTKADLLEMNLGSFGGLDDLMKRLIREDRPREIVAMFKEMILSSVGRKSPDGRRFIRNEEIRNDFYETEAYSELFTELVTDGEKLREFLYQVIPDDVRQAVLAKDAAEAAKEQPKLEVLNGGEADAGDQPSGH